MRKFLVICLSTFGLTAASALAQRDTGEPTLDVDTIEPAQGTVLDKNESRVTFTGTATDTADTANGETITGVHRVEYRINNRRRWKRATLVNPKAETTDFFFTVAVKKGSSVRVTIRVRDKNKNESDYLGRRVRRSRIVLPRESGTSSVTPLPGDGGTVAPGT